MRTLEDVSSIKAKIQKEQENLNKLRNSREMIFNYSPIFVVGERAKVHVLVNLDELIKCSMETLEKLENMLK